MKLPIPDDWDGTSWCRFSICWPDSTLWRGILLGFITQPGRGRFWDEKTGTIKDVQLIGRQIQAENIPLKEVIMACGDTGLQELADAILAASNTTAIEKLAEAVTLLAMRQCCTDLQVNTSYTPQFTITQPDGEVIPISGTQPTITIDPGTFPEGYASEVEYKAAKCQVATALVKNYIATLQFLIFIADVNLTFGILASIIGGGLPFTILITIEVLPVIVGLLVVIAVAKVALGAWVDYLKAHEQDLICALYNASSTEQAASDLIAIVFTGLALVPGLAPWVYAAARTIALTAIGSDWLNQLFTFQAALAYPDADCSQCFVDCFTFETDLQGWQVTNQGSGSLTIAWVDGSMRVTTDANNNHNQQSIDSPTMGHVVELGDRLLMCLTADPVPFGMRLTVLFNSAGAVDLENSGTITDHDPSRCYSLDPYEGDTIEGITFAISRFGGGVWDISEIGINCPCQSVAGCP